MMIQNGEFDVQCAIHLDCCLVGSGEKGSDGTSLTTTAFT